MSSGFKYRFGAGLEGTAQEAAGFGGSLGRSVVSPFSTTPRRREYAFGGVVTENGPTLFGTMASGAADIFSAPKSSSPNDTQKPSDSGDTGKLTKPSNQETPILSPPSRPSSIGPETTPVRSVFDDIFKGKKKMSFGGDVKPNDYQKKAADSGNLNKSATPSSQKASNFSASPRPPIGSETTPGRSIFDDIFGANKTLTFGGGEKGPKPEPERIPFGRQKRPEAAKIDNDALMMKKFIKMYNNDGGGYTTDEDDISTIDRGNGARTLRSRNQSTFHSRQTSAWKATPAPMYSRHWGNYSTHGKEAKQRRSATIAPLPQPVMMTHEVAVKEEKMTRDGPSEEEINDLLRRLLANPGMADLLKKKYKAHYDDMNKFLGLSNPENP